MTGATRRNGRFARLVDVVDLDALTRAHVVVVGLGSGGSAVALELAKAGIGHLTLIDPDHLEEPNLIRHECDDRYLGWNKAEAVADLVRHRNPAARVDVLADDVFALGDRFEDAVRGASLVAACTDGEAPKHFINRLCLAHRVHAVYAGVYEKGVGGEIVRCMPVEACYACVTSVLKESAPVPRDGDEELDYGAVDADGTLHGAPGLGLDVHLIALLHAKVCLLTLLDPDSLPGNVVLFGTAPVEGLFPRAFASAFVTLTPQDDCLVCAPYRGGALSIDARAV